jgi:hypothetical protein
MPDECLQIICKLLAKNSTKSLHAEYIQSSSSSRLCTTALTFTQHQQSLHSSSRLCTATVAIKQQQQALYNH